MLTPDAGAAAEAGREPPRERRGLGKTQQHFPRQSSTTRLVGAIHAVLAADGYAANGIFSPTPGVLCDKYLCANATEGVSFALTEQFLRKQVVARLRKDGDFDRTEFTLSNGVFCDVKERLCRVSRYYNADGTRDKISDEFTTLLFPKR